MDCSPPGSSVHRIFQERILEGVATSFSMYFLSYVTFLFLTLYLLPLSPRFTYFVYCLSSYWNVSYIKAEICLLFIAVSLMPSTLGTLMIFERMKMHAQLLSHIWLCDGLDCSPPGSSVHRIFLERILEWVASISSWPRDWTCISWVSCIGRQVLNHWTTWEDHKQMNTSLLLLQSRSSDTISLNFSFTSECLDPWSSLLSPLPRLTLQLCSWLSFHLLLDIAATILLIL